MCDIWKGNNNLRQLGEQGILDLLSSLKKFKTTRVVMTGGEPLLNPLFFRFCEILKSQKIKISLLSTGLTIKKHAPNLVKWIDDIIVSLDGDESTHDRIRNIPGAFRKLMDGVATIMKLAPDFPIHGRTVIHQLNFRNWFEIIVSAKKMGLRSISFLPADVSSNAFNREDPWSVERQDEILLPESALPELHKIISQLPERFHAEFISHFIAESPQKLRNIYGYYAAFYRHNTFPFKKCNAPWVSTVIEPDGTVRPCFFHKAYGNIKNGNLDSILNSDDSIEFRKTLDIDTNEVCIKCVCYLNLKASAKV